MTAKITDELVTKMAEYFVTEKSTVRETANRFGVSKSTVHSVLRNKVQGAYLQKEVDALLKLNRIMGPIRGGEATRIKSISKRLNKT